MQLTIEPRPLAWAQVARPGIVCEGDVAERSAWQEVPEAARLGEPALEEGEVVERVGGRDKQDFAPRSAHDGGVDARRWRERAPRNASDERELVPSAPVAAEQRRRPHRGALRGEPPLDDRVELDER